MKTLILSPAIKCIIVVLLCLTTGRIVAQEADSCAVKLKMAQSNFDKGQLEQVPGLLTGCLRSGFKKEDAMVAYKLVIQTYLLNDRLELADSAMLAFLKRYPEYKLSPTDHSSFVYLYNNFRVKPILMLSLRVGTSFPFLTFVTEHPVAMTPVSSVFSKNASNLYLSAEARYRFTDRLEASAEIGYSQLQFRNYGPFLEIGEFNYTEYQKRLEIPLAVSYEIMTFGKSLSIYLRAGMGVALDLSATADATFNYLDNLNNDQSSGILNRNDSRKFIDLFGQTGGGVRYKIPRGYFFGEIRCNFGSLNQNVTGGQTVQDLENLYKWKDPDFRLNNINFCVGWTYILYKPAKNKD
jgi:hypothetical protein